jgi:hypothetical protein
MARGIIHEKAIGTYSHCEIMSRVIIHVLANGTNARFACASRCHVRESSLRCILRAFVLNLSFFYWSRCRYVGNRLCGGRAPSRLTIILGLSDQLSMQGTDRHYRIQRSAAAIVEVKHRTGDISLGLSLVYAATGAPDKGCPTLLHEGQTSWHCRRTRQILFYPAQCRHCEA